MLRDVTAAEIFSALEQKLSKQRELVVLSVLDAHKKVMECGWRRHEFGRR